MVQEAAERVEVGVSLVVEEEERDGEEQGEGEREVVYVEEVLVE